MKKSIPLLLFSPLILSACAGQTSQDTQQQMTHSPEANVSGDYVGSDYEGNYVWAGAMNLAWNELNETILEEPLALDTENQETLKIVDAFNEGVFNKEDLDEASYYVHSGYGQEAVDQINQESQEKFPEKSFANLDLELSSTDFIVYAYLLKQVEYLEPFQVKELEFEGKRVKGFEADETRNVEVVDYSDDDHFIIKLPLKEEEDELILAKGFKMEDPEAVLEALSEHDLSTTEEIRAIDRFETPMITLDYERKYPEIIGQFLANEGFEDHMITEMYEKIKFEMDEVGAKVENEAVIAGPTNAAANLDTAPPTPRNFILDKPYWIIMKQANSESPYFILGIRNMELMEEANE